MKTEGVVVDLDGDEGDCVGLLSLTPDGGWLDRVDYLQEGLSGGKRWVAIVDVSWGCLNSEAVRSLWRVYMIDPRMCRRHSFGLQSANAGLYIVHVSWAGLGGWCWRG